MYILTCGTNNYLRIFLLYSCSYAELTEVKGNDKIHCIVSMEKDLVAQGTSILGPQIKGPMIQGTSILGSVD